jgi:outer membrane protein assembly factor BamB
MAAPDETFRPDPDAPPEIPEITPDTPWFQYPFFRHLIVILLPEAGLLVVWTHRTLPRWKKWVASALIVLYMPFHALGAIAFLAFVGLIDIEWKGGFGPTLVRQRTQPNYWQLEQNRAEHAARPSPAAASAGAVPYWTDFRGPLRDGHYREQPIATNWPPEGPRRLWQQPGGGGYASFVVAEGRAFTIEQRREDEAVVAYDIETGRELWIHRYPARFEEWMGGEGPRATPTYHDNLLYSLGATGEFCCLGIESGRVLWRQNILSSTESTNLRYGLATSPLIVEEKVIVLNGAPAPGKSLLAYHRVSADLLWSALDDTQAYVSPMLVTLAGERQVLDVTATRAVGLRPQDGRLLWEFPWRVQYDNSIAMPVLVSSNRFLLSAGYGAGCVLVEIARTTNGLAAHEVWRNRNLKNKFNSSVCLDQYIYGLDEGVLCCLDAATGERQWRDGRYGYGQLLLASGHLIVLGGEGDLYLVQANPTAWIEVAHTKVLTGKTWNVPALAHGRLLVRNGAEMACLNLRPPARPAGRESTGPPRRP